MYCLQAKDLSKRFGPRKVFDGINFDIPTGSSLAIVGPNGSGKSTLLMTLLGSYQPTRGKISYLRNGDSLSRDDIRAQTSLVSPYLNLYDNLTGEENLVFFATVSGCPITGKDTNALLTRVGLEGRGPDLVRSYSSGMKQRLKYAVALLNEPAFLFLDEPTSNLDRDGKEIVVGIIEEYRRKAIILIATNEEEEQSLATEICRVNQ